MRVTELVAVIYSAGVVFDGLNTSRPATERFLRTGETDGVRGRTDLALLEDLRDGAEVIVEKHEAPLDAALLVKINGAMTRSAALHPGRLRTDDQGIGVRTKFGRHEPKALSMDELDALVTKAIAHGYTDPERAVFLFLYIAKAQPFEDGNKRTAILAANRYLIGKGSPWLMVAPHAEDDLTVEATFNDLLARWYLSEESLDCTEILSFMLSNAFVSAPWHA